MISLNQVDGIAAIVGMVGDVRPGCCDLNGRRGGFGWTLFNHVGLATQVRDLRADPEHCAYYNSFSEVGVHTGRVATIRDFAISREGIAA